MKGLFTGNCSEIDEVNYLQDIFCNIVGYAIERSRVFGRLDNETKKMNTN